ncbi:MAG: DJ-1/PfpI family protein, partial [Ginsengibacter sp.]
DRCDNKTSIWLEALATAYFILKDGGESVTIASANGGEIPFHNDSLLPAAVTKNTMRCRQDAQANYYFSHSLPLNEINAENYDLVFIADGYGAMFDFANNKKLNRTLEDFYYQNKPIGLVGHGVVTLLSLKAIDGAPLIKGKRLTGFSNNEEELNRLDNKLPFLLESRLTSLGALYSKGPSFKGYVVVDGNIITGQNSASSIETATQLLSLARKKKSSPCEKNKELISNENDRGKKILKKAKEMNADLVLMETNSQNGKRKEIMETVAETVLLNTSVPLIFVPVKSIEEK